MDFQNGVAFKYNVNSNGSPMSIHIVDEVQQVSPITNSVQLVQIPDEFYRLVVKNSDNVILREIFDIEKLTTNSYKVDYSHGLVYFHQDNAGKSMTFNYYGRGVELIHASRVMIDKNPMNYETLQQLTNKASDIINSVNQAEITFSENEKTRQYTFIEAEVNRNSEELKRQVSEIARDKKYEEAEKSRDERYTVQENERNSAFVLDQNNRNDEYQIWKSLAMDENNVVRLQAQIDEIKAILSQVALIENVE